MINFNTFRIITELLKKNEIRYWVFGGFALDGVRGKITRVHSDIDIYLQSNDLLKLKKLFNSKIYKFYKREKMYFIESAELKLGIVVLTKENDLIVANGNKTLAKYPKEIFLNEVIVSIEDFNFRIVPYEILALESRFSKYKSDKSFGTKLEYDKKLFNKIKTVKIRD